MHQLYLSLKILNVLNSTIRPTFLKRIKFLFKAITAKKPKWLATGCILSFLCLIIFNSSNSIRSFDTTTVEWLSSLEDRLKSRCKCNSTLKTLNHGINSMVYILLSFRLSDTVQNLSNLYETCDREKVEIVSLPGKRSLSPRMSSLLCTSKHLLRRLGKSSIEFCNAVIPIQNFVQSRNAESYICQKHLWKQNHNDKPVRVCRIFSRSGSVKPWVQSYKT